MYYYYFLFPCRLSSLLSPHSYTHDRIPKTTCSSLSLSLFSFFIFFSHSFPHSSSLFSSLPRCHLQGYTGALLLSSSSSPIFLSFIFFSFLTLYFLFFVLLLLLLLLFPQKNPSNPRRRSRITGQSPPASHCRPATSSIFPHFPSISHLTHFPILL